MNMKHIKYQDVIKRVDQYFKNDTSRQWLAEGMQWWGLDHALGEDSFQSGLNVSTLHLAVYLDTENIVEEPCKQCGLPFRKDERSKMCAFCQYVQFWYSHRRYDDLPTRIIASVDKGVRPGDIILCWWIDKEDAYSIYVRNYDRLSKAARDELIDVYRTIDGPPYYDKTHHQSEDLSLFFEE